MQVLNEYFTCASQLRVQCQMFASVSERKLQRLGEGGVNFEELILGVEPIYNRPRK